MFFDILMLDDDICLAKPQRERRLLLQKVVNRISGRSDLAYQEVLDFGREDSYHRLERSFEKAITQRWEGYVLKASDEPYFPIYSTGVNHMFGRWIKLKKDYIPGLGDTVDLAIIGGSYISRDVQSLSQIKNLKWTHFFVGCLLNKEGVQKDGSIPHFRVVDVIGRHSMSMQSMQFLNQFGEFYRRSPDEFEGFAVEYGHNGLPKASDLFKKPFVVEMLGSGFEKPSGARYFTLRFPRILKVHSDRTMEDAASFCELQILAEDARAVPLDELEELSERDAWYKRLNVGSLPTQSIERESDPEATCSDTDSEPKSPVSQIPVAPTASEDSYMEARPLIDCLVERSTSKRNLAQSLGGDTRVPSIYIDEATTSPMDPELPPGEGSVLVNNMNLASHRASSQKDEKLASQSSENYSFPAEWLQQPLVPGPAFSGTSSSMRTTSSFNVPNGLSQCPQELETVGHTAERSYLSLKRKLSPQSPLATIPLWTPETSFGSFTLPKTRGNNKQEVNSHALQEFIVRISSNAAASRLEQSNPYAAAQCIRYGIIIFNPSMTALGKEMHRVVITLSSLANRDIRSVASVGKVFFLASSMLTRDLRPDDCRFCLRETWEQIGSEHYYGCISWDLRLTSIHSVPRRAGAEDASILNPLTLDDQSLNSRSEPWIKISFDDLDVAVLGEYTSIDPPSHVRDV